MIPRITDSEYEELRTRVLQGKYLCYENTPAEWTREDRKDAIDLYCKLFDQVIEQAVLRGVFTKQNKDISPNRIPNETPNEYVDRMRAKLIEEGKFTGRWAKPWLRAYRKRKEGGEAIQNVPTKSENYSLF